MEMLVGQGLFILVFIAPVILVGLILVAMIAMLALAGVLESVRVWYVHRAMRMGATCYKRGNTIVIRHAKHRG